MEPALTFLGGFRDMSTLSPHGACLLRKPGLIWLNAVSDAMACVAFFATAFVLGLYSQGMVEAHPQAQKSPRPIGPGTLPTMWKFPRTPYLWA